MELPLVGLGEPLGFAEELPPQSGEFGQPRGRAGKGGAGSSRAGRSGNKGWLQ
jgi:hypothetical protein